VTLFAYFLNDIEVTHPPVVHDAHDASGLPNFAKMGIARLS